MTFKECLKRGRIKEFSQGKALVNKELQTAERDLLDGKEGFEREKYKWSTIQNYYAMFHSARVLLYATNYREKSHHCLIIALRHLICRNREIAGIFCRSSPKRQGIAGRR